VGDPNNEEEKVVTIALTKLDVNDTTIELSYKIKNNTDHDVWICDSVNVLPRACDFEVYMPKDAQTLVIRRRLDVPTAKVWAAVPYGRYVLLRSGQERFESLSLDVPVHPCRVFASGRADSGHARRLVLEIGFYNEDLPATIRDILEMAWELNCTGFVPSMPSTFFIRYFEGIWIAHWLFGVFSNQEGNEEIEIPYTWQKFSGEQVLRLEVDGVHIPYEELSATDAPANSEVEDADVTMALTGLDVNDQTLELRYKIKNGTNHDVWICDGVVLNGSELEFEAFIDRDGETLLIRKRFNVPVLVNWAALPKIEGRFIRLRAGQQRSETLSLALPVHLQVVFTGTGPIVKHIKRLLLEIGFFNEDLPELIRSILRVAEMLNCAQLPRQHLSSKDHEILSDYFRGIDISELFGGLSGFNQSYPDVSENITLPYMCWPEGGIKDEQTVQIIINDISIPIAKLI
jgi:hypothetical protein